MGIKGTNQSLSTMSLSGLKIELKTADKEVAQKQKELNNNVKSINNEIALPERTAKRYQEAFGKAKEKSAVKLTMLFFAIAFTIGFFLQPSIYFHTKDDQINLINLSNRTINDITVYTSDEFFSALLNNKGGPILSDQSIPPKGQITLTAKKTTIYLAFADRQLPAMGVVEILNSYGEQNINNPKSDNNGGIYGGLKQ